ncbi:hypothetical protein CVT26_014759 [Gymnopilus dilepis]|uniref:Uncharacterized protein n=1 Tax=Gymnopilus dilepis TaxID=231916 RepID=A0A409YNP0_9AGAR|nr:hypothetical protein CVT26_014759 [Gymnopilus dilepis]
MADVNQTPESTNSLIAMLPNDCSNGIKLTLNLALADSWGSKWEDLLKLWLQFEKMHNFKGSSHLGTASRPREVGDWIQRARSASFRPVIEPTTYGQRFWNWWAGLQPEWRVIQQNTTSRSIAGSWEALNKPGTNGLASVIAALFFWGFRLGEEREATSSWVLARDDVHWVLTQLSTSD